LKKTKLILEAVVVIAVVMALILPGSAVFTNNEILNQKNVPFKTHQTTLSAINKIQPNPEPVTRQGDVLVSWDNPDEDDELPKITANADGVIVITYEMSIDVLTRVNPISYSDDDGETWNIQFLIDSAEYDGSGTTESPDIKYAPARDDFIFTVIDPLEAEYHVIMSWCPADIAGTTEIPIFLYSWIEGDDYIACANSYVGEWLLTMDVHTGHDIIQVPGLSYYWYSWEDEWAYHPEEVDPEWCAGGYYDGQSVLETSQASKPEMATGANRIYMVMETYDEGEDMTKISYKATYADLDPDSEFFLFQRGGGPGGMDKYADIEVWPFQEHLALNAADPDVSAAGSTVAVVYSQGGDVKCKASNNNGDTFSETTVATGAGYPCVYVAGARIYVAYVQDENLYITHSDNLGGSWDTPIRINDEDDSVAEQPGTADIGEYGIVWTDTRDGQLDIFFEYMSLAVSNPPGKPSITGPANGQGDPEVAIPFKFNAVDPDGDQVKYHINWGDGNTDTTTLKPSGQDVEVSHTWTQKDTTYTITAYAEDSNGVIGPTETDTIYIPRPRGRFYNLFDIFPNLFRFLNIILG
jgi:hypothetical protein